VVVAWSGRGVEIGRGGPAPRKQFVDPVDGVIGDTVEDVAEVGERIDAVQLAGLDQGVDRRGARRFLFYPWCGCRHPLEG
jgi:hypothetical protein